LFFITDAAMIPISRFLISISICCAFFHVNAQRIRGWKLVWREEFKYQGLPNKKKWSYEVGHIRNQEQQYYTEAREENIRVSNGVLTITGRKELFVNKNYRQGSTDWRSRYPFAQYTSASINTEGKAAWQYGRIEIKAKMPRGGGMWPALWMMGVNRSIVGWPHCGEIDIMEFIGNHPTEVHATIHYADTVSRQHKSNGSKINDATLTTSFHKYAMEWDEEKIDIYFDDKKFHTFLINTAGSSNENRLPQTFLFISKLRNGGCMAGARR
jgi:beta-glucanase (GH16 family)